MYYFLYNSVIYNANNVETIKDLKHFIIENFKNLYEKNLILSFNTNKKTIQPKNNDELIQNILYTLTIKPIDCETHNF